MERARAAKTARGRAVSMSKVITRCIASNSGEEHGRQSARHDQSCPRTWANRRDDDCYRLDDRVWDLHRFGGVIAIEWRAGLAVARMGACRLADDYRPDVLFRVC